MAVKIIEHSAESSSGIKELRESVLSSSIIHPNVVSTYKIRTIPAACPKSCQAYQEVHSPTPALVSAPKAALTIVLHFIWAALYIASRWCATNTRVWDNSHVG